MPTKHTGILLPGQQAAVVINENDPLVDKAQRLWAKKEELEEMKAEYERIRGEMLDAMIKSDVTRLDLDFFSVNLKHSIKYKQPTPEQVRAYLGDKLASRFIEEVVKPDEDGKTFRESVPEKISDEICPVISESAFVEVRKR